MTPRGLLAAVLLATAGITAVACSGSTASLPTVSAEPTATTETAAAEPEPAGAQPRLAGDPAVLADDLVADELALRDPATPEDQRVAAARRQQAAYRAIGRNPQWDAIVRPRIPESLGFVFDRNIDARRQLNAMAEVRDTLPAWRIVPPAPADQLLGYYREAEAAYGVPWNYLAAINLIETRFGSIVGTSTAGAQGPMQFMPATWAEYGQGGNLRDPRDAILGAARYLAANGFAADPDHAIFRYNNARQYVRAVNDFAAVMAADPSTFGSYYLWDVYYFTTAGEVLLPIGYDQPVRIPVADYLATHPQ
ncbi:MAG: lytic murein transglycosylase [Mycobacterium sp.]|nr:lytic murein transglycosylase [Mycobacterium sp.]